MATKAWWRNLPGVMLVGLVAVSCSSGEPEVPSADDEDRITSTSEATSATEPGDTSKAARAYFDALAQNDVAGRTEAQRQAEPDSLAYFYALYLTEAGRLGQSGEKPSRVTVDAGIVKLCQTDLEGEEGCYTFRDVSVNDAGQVVSFTADEVSLKDRLGFGGTTVTSSGIAASVLVAYEATAGNLFLLVDVSNGAAEPFVPYLSSSTYVGADGRQDRLVYSSGIGVGVESVATGASAYDLLLVESGKRGGTLNYGGELKDSHAEVTLALPVP